MHESERAAPEPPFFVGTARDAAGKRKAKKEGHEQVGPFIVVKVI